LLLWLQEQLEEVGHIFLGRRINKVHDFHRKLKFLQAEVAITILIDKGKDLGCRQALTVHPFPNGLEDDDRPGFHLIHLVQISCHPHQVCLDPFASMEDTASGRILLLLCFPLGLLPWLSIFVLPLWRAGLFDWLCDWLRLKLDASFSIRKEPQDSLVINPIRKEPKVAAELQERLQAHTATAVFCWQVRICFEKDVKRLAQLCHELHHLRLQKLARQRLAFHHGKGLCKELTSTIIFLDLWSLWLWRRWGDLCNWVHSDIQILSFLTFLPLLWLLWNRLRLYWQLFLHFFLFLLVRNG